ncbi:MAG: helix-turn-helix domain-containing protein [Ilumatobacteraceae bacterium]
MTRTKFSELRDNRQARLDVTQGAISKLEHSDDVSVSTLWQYLEALGAHLELVAVFDDEDRRVPIHLGRNDAA